MIRYPTPWIPNNQPGFWNSYNVGDSWGRTFPTSGGESGGVNVNPSATSRGTTYPFGQPRGLPSASAFFGDTRPYPQVDDAQMIKFKPGQNPSVDALRRGNEAAERVGIPLDMAARALASGTKPVWDSLHQQWGVSGGEGSRGGPNYGSRPDLYPSVQQGQERYQSILDWLGKLQTQPVGTPALNEFNQRFGNQQNQNSNTGYRPLWG